MPWLWNLPSLMNSEIHKFSPFYTRIISEIISFIKCQKFDLTKFKSALPVPVNNTASNATYKRISLLFVNRWQIGKKHFISSFAIKKLATLYTLSWDLTKICLDWEEDTTNNSGFLKRNKIFLDFNWRKLCSNSEKIATFWKGNHLTHWLYFCL